MIKYEDLSANPKLAKAVNDAIARQAPLNHALKLEQQQPLEPIRKNKYGAIKAVADGVKFDSKAEAKLYLDNIKPRVLAGEIDNLNFHPKYPIIYNGIKICDVILDFAYREVSTGQIHHVDYKGRDNPVSRLKRKLLKAHYLIDVEVVTKPKKGGGK